MSLLHRMAAICTVLALAVPTMADTVTQTIGGDTYVSGSSIVEAFDTPRDAFVAGNSAVTRGTVQGDLHVIGFDTSVDAVIGSDLYALGATVVVRGSIAEDLSVAGYSVRTEPTAETRGNARLLGGSLVIEGPVAGALSAVGRDVVLNAAIAGDASITAKTLTFGPDARVDGTLHYRSESRIEVPAHVAPPERISYQELPEFEGWQDWDDGYGFNEMPALPTFASIFFAFVVSVLFFILLGALALGFMPQRVEKLRDTISAAPGKTLLLGVLGLSILFGMVPITGMTIVGLPFVPIVVLSVILAWTLGYALGAYAVAMRLWAGFGGSEAPGVMARLLAFAGVIVAIALLNFIPFVGWVANYTLVLLGIGAGTNALFQYLIGNPGPALDVDMNPIER